MDSCFLIRLFLLANFVRRLGLSLSLSLLCSLRSLVLLPLLRLLPSQHLKRQRILLPLFLGLLCFLILLLGLLLLLLLLGLLLLHFLGLLLLHFLGLLHFLLGW